MVIRLTVATCDPQNLTVQDELRTFLGLQHPHGGCHRTRDSRLIDKYYSSELDTMERIIADLAEDDELFQGGRCCWRWAVQLDRRRGVG
jgi:type IV pilus assembly protein PilB